MALPPFAELSALLVRVGRSVSEAESARAAAILDDISTEVRDKTKRTWCTEAGELDPARPPMIGVITMRAAERAVRNPALLHSESLGDYRRTFAERAMPDGVYLTDSEIEILERLAGIEQLASVPIERDVTVSDVVWLADQYGGDKIPWQVPL